MGLLDPLNPLSGLSGIPGVSELPGAESYVTTQGVTGGLTNLADALAKQQNPALAIGRTGLGFISGRQQGMTDLANMQKLRQDILKSGLDIQQSQYNLMKAPLDIQKLGLDISEKELDVSKKQVSNNAILQLLQSLPKEELALAASNPDKWLDAYYKRTAPSGDIIEYEYAKDQFKQGIGQDPGSFGDWYRNMIKLKTPTTNINMPSESERTAGFLTTRVQENLNTINRVVQQNPNAAAPAFGAEAVGFLTGSDYLKRLANPSARQQIETAQLDLLDAALTLATGAAYNMEQKEGLRLSYFPQLGDKPDVIKDKAERLQSLLRAARIKSGRAAPGDVGLPPGVTVKKVEKK